MSEKIWRCAVVGTGVVGEWHMRLIPALKQARLVAVCDLDADKAHQKLQANKLEGVAVYTDIAQMLQKEQLDAVHICTPSGNHLPPAMTAIDAGVNVICEKPMEIKLDRIDAMIAAASKKGVRLAGIFQNRWNPSNRAIRDAVASGRFGRLAYGGCHTPWYRTDQYYRDGGWRGTWALDGGGAIMNQSVHAVDLLQWICGPVKRVSAHASSRIHAEIEVEDTLVAALTFESGAHGMIMGSTAMYPGGAVRIEVGGENGTAVTDGSLKRYEFRDKKVEDQELIERVKHRGAGTAGGASNVDVSLELHLRNLTHIFDAWASGHDADTHGGEARKAVAIILAMYESARRGGEPITVG